MSYLVTAAAVLLSITTLAQAGRPLATDDAGTADAGTCQFEAWHERSGRDRATVLAPACGVLPGLELGADYTHPRPREAIRGGAGLALKWAPASWALDTRAGELRVGVRLDAAWARRPLVEGWQHEQSGLLGLTSLKLSDDWTLLGNFGIVKERIGGTRATVGSLALVWAPTDAWLLFAEAQTNNRREAFGGTMSSVGVRRWLVQDTLGLDLTSSRESGTGGPTRWSIGIGLYGIGP